jgi:hypothetical protein
MNKLSKEKRNQLVLVVLVTVGLLVGLYFGVIRAQLDGQQRAKERTEAARQKLEMVKRAIATADTLEVQVAETGQRLAKLEDGMASGDLYSWVIDNIRKFNLNYKVEIPQFSAIDGPRDVLLLGQFPYRQASLTIGGTAEFYDLGRFLADFRN